MKQRAIKLKQKASSNQRSAITRKQPNTLFVLTSKMKEPKKYQSLPKKRRYLLRSVANWNSYTLEYQKKNFRNTSKELPPEIQRLINEYAKPLCRPNWRRSITPSCTALHWSNEYRDYRYDVLESQESMQFMGLAADAAAAGVSPDSFEETLEYIEESLSLCIDRNYFLVTENTTWYKWCSHNGILLDDWARKEAEQEDVLHWHEIDNGLPEIFFGYDQGYQYKKRAGYWVQGRDRLYPDEEGLLTSQLGEELLCKSWVEWAQTNSGIGRQDGSEEEILEKFDAAGFAWKHFKKLMKNSSKPNDFARWYRRK